MTAPSRKFFIIGTTGDGRTFRPSDWAERLAGAMSVFRPPGTRADAFIGYSPYCVPTFVDGVRSVEVDEAVRGIEPLAWEFVANFARDNDLRMVSASPAAPARAA